MIEKKKYQEVLDTGLTLDHYFVLKAIRDETPLPSSRRIQGFLNLLNKKGYIEDGCLTVSALKLIECYDTTLSVCTTTTERIKDDSGVIDFQKWILGLHKRCQEKIKHYTGAPQVRGKINGKSYSFLCNSIDLGRVLIKVINLYKLKDLDAIENCIMKHISDCCISKQYFPLIKYYVMKDNSSQLVTDLENPDNDIKGDFKSTQKFV